MATAAPGQWGWQESTVAGLVLALIVALVATMARAWSVALPAWLVVAAVIGFALRRERERHGNQIGEARRRLFLSFSWPRRVVFCVLVGVGVAAVIAVGMAVIGEPVHLVIGDAILVGLAAFAASLVGFRPRQST